MSWRMHKKPPNVELITPNGNTDKRLSIGKNGKNLPPLYGLKNKPKIFMGFSLIPDASLYLGFF